VSFLFAPEHLVPVKRGCQITPEPVLFTDAYGDEAPFAGVPPISAQVQLGQAIVVLTLALWREEVREQDQPLVIRAECPGLQGVVYAFDSE
jgi:hypothetical protein